jgi:hypothetical protein
MPYDLSVIGLEERIFRSMELRVASAESVASSTEYNAFLRETIAETRRWLDDLDHSRRLRRGFWFYV